MDFRIWGDVPKVSGVYDKQKHLRKVEGAEKVVSRKDAVSISGPAKDYQTVMKALKDVPEIRQEKIGKLVDEYEAGTLDIDGKQTAEKILKSILGD